MTSKRSKKTLNKELPNEQESKATKNDIYREQIKKAKQKVLKNQLKNKDDQNQIISIKKGRGLGMLHKIINENKNVSDKDKKQLLNAIKKGNNDLQNDTESKEKINKRKENESIKRQNNVESNDMDISDEDNNEQDFIGDDYGNNNNQNKPLRRKKRKNLTPIERNKNIKSKKKGNKEETSL
eukprot:19996_1